MNTGTISAVEGRLESIVETLRTTALLHAPGAGIQAAVQRNTNAAAPKTVNLPETASVEDVRDILWRVWRTGPKGIAVSRPGSRPDQLLRLPDPGRARVGVHGSCLAGSLAAGMPPNDVDRNSRMYAVE
jgi:hypothetical protein